ncbi:MAG TPA: hypothetical protein DIT64_17455 [Verrucomicrobiales bacterium]|nr:hypothetical protein [Verrucomicrobiales bacterium]
MSSLKAAALCCGAALTGIVPAAQAREVFFEDHIAPLLERSCRQCHNAETKRANLDLSSPATLMRGSDAGVVVKAGDPKHSLLYELVHSGEMPRKGDKLTHDEAALIAEWIEGGARFRLAPVAVENGPRKHDILPVLLLRCTACHGAELQRGGLDLRFAENMLQGGQSGPAVVPGKPDESLAIQRVEKGLCPPQDQLLKFFVERPGGTEVEKLREWVAAGASMRETPPDIADGAPDPLVTDEDRKHWAFQPLPAAVPVPASPDGLPMRPVDAFIHEKLRAAGLDFSLEAERHSLIRRAYFDLIGLPPSTAELARWMEHLSDGWFAEMVDHLLASPHYGERWGRFWLDVAGYSDSEGGTTEDPVREVAWKYRDYVIRAFNDDKPWDRFLHEQLAGDELADHTDPAKITDEVTENLIATGFLRMGVDQTGSRTMNFVPERLGVISDAIQVVGSGILGLTLDCARCHSHKYDAIPQRDYYRLKAVFQGAFDEHDWMTWKTRKLETASPEAMARHKEVNGPLEKEIKALETTRTAALKKLQDEIYKQRWPALDKAGQEEILAAVKANAIRRTLRQVELVKRYETEFRPVEAVLVKERPAFAEELRGFDEKLASLRARLLPPLTVRALWDRGRPSPTYLLSRGEAHRPTRLVGPGVPSVLTDGRAPFETAPPWPGAEKTGRRLAFAQWLTGPDHPLTARVLVNRVWAQHFGRGIVSTLENFGVQGARPTHPELLDWLARDFVSNGWSLKHLHRVILNSRTWRQSSHPASKFEDRNAKDADPENLLLSRMNLRRLDAEALRDALHAVSGRLDPALHGPPSPVTVREDGLIMEQERPGGMFRRSLYLRLRRTEMPSMLATFDYPEMQPNCVQRSISTVSLQPLMLQNNARVRELAAAFAARLESASGDDDPAAIRLAFETALQRPPDAAEATDSLAALSQLTAAWQETGATPPEARLKALATFCHTLLNSAGFLYLD